MCSGVTNFYLNKNPLVRIEGNFQKVPAYSLTLPHWNLFSGNSRILLMYLKSIIIFLQLTDQVKVNTK